MDIIFAFIIVIVVVMIYMLSAASSIQQTARKAYDHINATPEKLTQESTGVADGPALLALKKTLKKKKKTSNDQLTIARLLSDNILEGNVAVKPGTKKAEITAEAGRRYLAATQTADLARPDVEHLFNTAEAFERRLEDNLFNELLVGEMMFPGGFEAMGDPGFDPVEAAMMADNDGLNQFGLLAHDLRGNVSEARKVHAAVTKQIAKSESKTVNEAREKYFKKSQTHTSDSQNSHDSNVSKEIKNTMDILQRDNPAPLSKQETVGEITAYINGSDMTDAKKKKVLASLKKITDVDANISAADRNESEVLRLVWARANDPRNKENSDAIRGGVADALVDISANNYWGEGHTVCPNGRVARLAGSLSTLDHNKAVGNLQTKEQIKNHIMENAAKVRRDVVAAAKKSSDEEVKIVAEAFDTPDGPDESLPGYKTFMSTLKAAADKMLTENMASDDIKNDVYIGMDLA